MPPLPTTPAKTASLSGNPSAPTPKFPGSSNPSPSPRLASTSRSFSATRPCTAPSMAKHRAPPSPPPIPGLPSPPPSPPASTAADPFPDHSIDGPALQRRRAEPAGCRRYPRNKKRSQTPFSATSVPLRYPLLSLAPYFTSLSLYFIFSFLLALQ